MIRKINTAIDPGVALHLISFARALNESSRRQVNRATPPGSPRRRARSTLLSLNPAGQWTRQGHCYASDVYPIPSQPRSADEPILPGQQNKRLPGQRR